MYRMIDVALWSDPKLHKLSANERYVFVYLITNPHTHVSGIYYLPDSTATFELGLSEAEFRHCLDGLAEADFIAFDTETRVVWVKNMLRYQSNSPTGEIASANHLKSLHKSFLINSFLDRYPAVRRLYEGRVSIPPRYPPGTPPIGYRDKDKDKEKEKDQEKEQKDPPPEDCSELPKSGNSELPSIAPEGSITFPCVGKGSKTHTISAQNIANWQSDYPGIDVYQSLINARNWCRANPKKRKTEKGMPSFIVRWLNRDQDDCATKKGRSNRSGEVDMSGIRDFYLNNGGSL